MILVVLYHFQVDGFELGFLGVDVFLVISGYLVGGSLLREVRNHGKLDFGRFITARARRILPAASMTIVLTLAVLMSLNLLTLRDIRQALWSSLYVQNINLQLEGSDYSASDLAQGYFVHFWSLSLEEQFYILCPVFLILSYKLFRGRVVRVIWVGTLLSLAFSILISFQGDPAAYYSLPSRAWQFGLGILASTANLNRSQAKYFWIASLSALLAMPALLGLFSSLPFPGFGATFPSISAALFLAAGKKMPVKILPRFLEWALVKVGDASYSIYLVHFAISVAVLNNFSAPGNEPQIIGGIVATFVLGFISKKLIEDPFRKPRQTWNFGQTASLIGLSLFALPAILVVSVNGLIKESDTQNLALESESKDCLGVQSLIIPECRNFLDAPMKINPAVASESLFETYRNKCHNPKEASEFKTCFYGETEEFSATIALVGDSHATQWLPALDIAGRELGIRVQTYTMGGCAFGYTTRENCERFREWVSESLDQRDQPHDVVMLSAIVHVKDKEDESYFENRRQAFVKSLGFLETLNTKILVIQDNPWGSLDRSDPNLCLLSEEPKVCTNNEDDVVFPSPYEHAVRDTGIGQIIETKSLFCSDSFCRIGAGGIPIYRDFNHVSVQYSQTTSHFWTQKLVPHLKAG